MAPLRLAGSTDAFLYGLSGLLDEGGLRRSMEEEFRENEGGKWWAEYQYVVHRPAAEDVDADGGPLQASTEGYHLFGKTSLTGKLVKRDDGHDEMSLADFCEHSMAKASGLSDAEVAALRLYTGPAFAPMNWALRNKDVSQWATTIACCYSGVLKLSFKSTPARVYRGVREVRERERERPLIFTRMHGRVPLLTCRCIDTYVCTGRSGSPGRLSQRRSGRVRRWRRARLHVDDVQSCRCAGLLGRRGHDWHPLCDRL